jgi:branched-chain amino acid transport system substrate-binding protein
MRAMRRRPGLLLAIMLILAIDSVGAAEEIRIGFATPLTGPFAATGARHRTAVMLAVRDLNARGGVLARPVRLVSADDACGVEQAEAAAQSLVDAGVVFVVGHLCSHSSLMAAPVYEAAGVPMMSTTSSHPRLTEEGRGNVFRLIGRDDAQGSLAGDLLAARWGRGRIAILNDGSTYGASLAAEARRRLHEHGVTEVLLTAYPPGREDYSVLVGQLRQAAIDVAYVGGYGPDAARIVRAAREGGDDLQLVGGHALGMAEFWSVAGRAGEGTLFTSRRDAERGPEEEQVLRELRAEGLGRRPTSLATYAAVQVWAQATERAGTADAAAVTEALHRGRFETVVGRVAFDAKGDLEGAAWQWQVWRDGDYEPLPSSVAMDPGTSHRGPAPTGGAGQRPRPGSQPIR